MIVRLQVLILFLLASVLIGGGLSACSGGPASENLKASTVSSPGQEIFLNHCMGCHMGSGDPPGPNDVILNSSRLASEAKFKAYIRQPDNNAMPPISAADVPDSNISKLYAYLKSAH